MWGVTNTEERPREAGSSTPEAVGPTTPVAFCRDLSRRLRLHASTGGSARAAPTRATLAQTSACGGTSQITPSSASALISWEDIPSNSP